MKNATDFTPVDVAIIGAGIAGLSAAVHARLSGLTARVFDRHYLPGGLCTAWKRKGYTFDYCVEYLVGTGPKHGFYRLWEDLGLIQDREFARIDTFGRYMGTDGGEFNLYTDPRRLRTHMLDISPEDAGMIEELCGAIGRAGRLVMSEFSLSRGGLSRLLRSLSALPTVTKWAKVSVRKWSEGFRSPLLREAFPELVGWTDFPMSCPIIAFGWMHAGLAAYPQGGSLPLALAVEARAKSLGAEIVYRTGVKRVLIEDGRAVGVELEDGRIQGARHVVAACDARSAFERLLEGRVKAPAYEAMFSKRQLSASLVQVSLGLKTDPAWGLTDLPQKLNLPVKRPVRVDGRERARLRLRNYVKDPSMAPQGSCVMLVQFDGDYDSWSGLRPDEGAYRAEKERILAETIRALDERFPGIAGRVEASDVATPTSCERYTDNWRGCMQGWMLTDELMKILTSGFTLPKAFPEIANFRLIGQWTEPGGGLPPSARTGRDAVRAIMKAEGKKAAR